MKSTVQKEDLLTSLTLINNMKQKSSLVINHDEHDLKVQFPLNENKRTSILSRFDSGLSDDHHQPFKDFLELFFDRG